MKITEEGFRDKKARLELLRNTLIPQTRQNLRAAREEGDLSENAEFEIAKRSLEGYNAEVVELTHALADVEVVIPAMFTLLNLNDNSQMTVGLTEKESHPPYGDKYGLVSAGSKLGTILSGFAQQGRAEGREFQYVDNVLRKQHFKVLAFTPEKTVAADNL